MLCLWWRRDWKDRTRSYSPEKMERKVQKERSCDKSRPQSDWGKMPHDSFGGMIFELFLLHVLLQSRSPRLLFIVLILLQTSFALCQHRSAWCCGGWDSITAPPYTWPREKFTTRTVTWLPCWRCSLSSTRKSLSRTQTSFLLSRYLGIT